MEIYFKNLSPEESTVEKLLEDLRILREDTEELFRASGGKLAEKSREKILTAMERVKVACEDIQGKATAGARITDQAVREYPYSALGIAFGFGIIIGILTRRK
ncbi:MAG: protein of unknown function ElaB [Pedosphaera sp.]|jgi:ElaB/YqjD/DUF883 family membrane-anchored ribosome-binding protein|nr:protein of unknown function ElaB [Pedosphaera sp.]